MSAVRFAGLLLLVSHSASATEPVEVWLTPPSILNAREAGDRITATSKIGLKKAEDRWKALGARDLSYVLDQFTTGILMTECDAEPLNVRISRGKVAAAAYAHGSSDCPRGAPPRAPNYSQPVLTPVDLFEVARSAIERDPECGVIVKYDDATGIPIHIEGGCWFMFDSGWSIKVSNIRISW